MMKRLKKNWGRLHKVVYLVSILALLHYFMMVKADYLVPGIMLVILSVLLGYRLVLVITKKKKMHANKRK